MSRDECHSPIATTSTQIEQLFGALSPRLDWRGVALKQALKELAGTLDSLLTQRDVAGRPQRSPLSECQLLQLLTPLLRAAVQTSHRESLQRAITLLTSGQPIDLLPLCRAAIADLEALPMTAPSRPPVEGE